MIVSKNHRKHRVNRKLQYYIDSVFSVLSVVNEFA